MLRCFNFYVTVYENLVIRVQVEYCYVSMEDSRYTMYNTTICTYMYREKLLPGFYNWGLLSVGYHDLFNTGLHKYR